MKRLVLILVVGVLGGGLLTGCSSGKAADAGLKRMTPEDYNRKVAEDMRKAQQKSDQLKGKR